MAANVFGAEDNIAADTVADDKLVAAMTEVTPDVTSDEYIKRFDVVEDNNRQLSCILANLPKCEHEEARLHTIIKYVNKLQAQNEAMFDLLVEMNNFFGK